MIGGIGGHDGSERLLPMITVGAEAVSDIFSNELGRWSERANPETLTEQGARDAAEELIAMTFVQPILKQMREMNAAAPPFSPGIAERRFGALWDADGYR